jgi:hypothetical protein
LQKKNKKTLQAGKKLNENLNAFAKYAEQKTIVWHNVTISIFVSQTLFISSFLLEHGQPAFWRHGPGDGKDQ